MTDIVKRLREGAYYVADHELEKEAADLIEQLQRENQLLRNTGVTQQQRIEELEKLLVVCGVDPEDLGDKDD